MKNSKYLIVSLILILLASGCTQAAPSTRNVETISETTSVDSSCSGISSSFIGNPAAFYCTEVMGYDYQTVTQEDGSQKGQCIMPDGEVCDQWAFYAGECGAAHSYCAQEDMTIETRSDGQDPYSKIYGVCTGSENRSEFRISDIIEFDLTAADKAKNEGATRAEQMPKLTDEMRASLPDHFDWRDIDGKNWMTPVKNQGGCGSCWAFSAVGVLEPYYNFINDNPDLDLDLSEENLVSDCFYTGCNGGWSEDALIYARDVGIVDEACMPYTATDSACATMCADPERYTVEQVFWDYYPLDVDLLKYFIVNYGPVSVYLYMDGDFTGDIYQCAGPPYNSNTYHAVVVVGYDDAGGYWIVKNSWGTDYEENGYYHVGYNQCEINSDFYAFLPTEVIKSYFPLISMPGTPFTTIPDITYPSEGDIVNTLKPTITWNVDNSLHDASYIYYQISPDYNLHEFSGGYRGYGYPAYMGSFELDRNLTEGTTYYMHAAYDYLDLNDDWIIGPYSEPITFTTGTGFNIPGKPNLLSPTDGAALADTNVILDWDPVAHADYYEVWLMWEDYLEPLGDVWFGRYYEPTVNVLDVSDFVEPDTQYQWDVRPVNDVAWGEYSEQWSFTTGTQASGTPRSEEGTEYELFIMTEEGETIPYELFMRNNP